MNQSCMRVYRKGNRRSLQCKPTRTCPSVASSPQRTPEHLHHPSSSLPRRNYPAIPQEPIFLQARVWGHRRRVPSTEEDISIQHIVVSDEGILIDKELKDVIVWREARNHFCAYDFKISQKLHSDAKLVLHCVSLLEVNRASQYDIVCMFAATLDGGQQTILALAHPVTIIQHPRRHLFAVFMELRLKKTRDSTSIARRRRCWFFSMMVNARTSAAGSN